MTGSPPARARAIVSSPIGTAAVFVAAFAAASAVSAAAGAYQGVPVLALGAGVAFSLLVLRGPKWAWLVVAARWVDSGFFRHDGLLLAGLTAVVYVLPAALAAWWLRRPGRFDPQLGRFRDAAALIAAMIFGAAGHSVLVGATLEVTGAASSNGLVSWMTLTAVVRLASLLAIVPLAVLTKSRVRPSCWRTFFFPAGISPFAERILVTVTAFVLAATFSAHSNPIPAMYPLAVPITWAAIRFGVRCCSPVVAAMLAGTALDLIEGRLAPAQAGAAEFFVSFLAGFALLASSRETERRLALANLMESEARRQEMLSRAPAGFLELDLSGRITECNRTAASLFDREDARLKGVRLVDLLPPTSNRAGRSRVEAFLARPTVGGAEQAVSWRLSGRDGAGIEVDATIWAIPEFDGGAPSRYGVFLVDRTARVRQMRALRASEARYRFVVDHASDVFIRVHPNGVVASMSRASIEMLGIRPEAAVGSSIEDLIVLDDRSGPLGPWLNPAGAGTTELTLLVTAAGPVESPKKMEARLRYLRPSNTDQVSEVIIVLRDVTEREAVNARLRHERLFLDSTLASLAEGIVACDREGRVTVVNQAAMALLGVWEGMSIRQIPNPAPLEAALAGRAVESEPYRPALEAGRSAGGATPRPGRSRQSLEVNGRPVVAEDGALVGAVMAVRDVTERAAHEERIKDMALTDPLTGLANRRAVMEYLEGALAHLKGTRPSRSGRERPLPARAPAVLFIDFDRFKQVNDHFGHDIGDLVLQEAAVRIRSCLRSRDVAGRLGGDEFVVVLHAVQGLDGAQTVVARIEEALAQPISVGGVQLAMTASIGVAVAGVGVSPEVLVQRADRAMYQVKRLPKGATGSQRPVSALDLAAALESAAIHLAFQPIVSLDSGRVVAVEGLARLLTPDGTVLTPNSFIPLAESTGLIVPLGQRVIELGLTARSDLMEAGWPEIAVSVNVSPLQLRAAGLIEAVAAGLSSFAPETRSGLWLELVETSEVPDDGRTATMMSRLAQTGAALVLDDLGAGYSSLAHLARYPFSVVKLDRCLISRIEWSTADQEVVRHVAMLGRSLGVTVVAEGIETKGQLEMAAKLGCDLAQGYHLGRPRPLGEILAELG